MKKWYVNIWGDGKYIDLWHLNHFLAGVLCAGLIIFLNIDMVSGFLISLVLMLSWEVYEIINNIQETQFNRTMDILLGILAFFLTYLWPRKSLGILFMISGIVWVILELWGYWAYKQKSREI